MYVIVILHEIKNRDFPSRQCKSCIESIDYISSIAVDCGTLTSPINGSVAVPTTTYNSVATYSCVTGYELNGDTIRTCQPNGTWSGSDLTCQRKL